jgi:hypothetical protein
MMPELNMLLNTLLLPIIGKNGLEKPKVKKSNAVAKKQQYENSLISKNPEIKNSLSEFNTLYNQQAPYALNNAYYTEILEMQKHLH